jgi:Trp operon repressor
MDTQALLKEKKIENKFENLHQRLLDNFNGKANTLTKAEAELGLVLLNCFAELREGYDPKKTEEDHWRYTDQVAEEHVRFKKLQEFNQNGDIWTKHTALIQFLFGEELLPFVQEALATFAELMYQQGWYRRSFRAPQRQTLHLVQQANFIIGLLNELDYDLSLSEYILYVNQYYKSEQCYVWAAALNQQDATVTELLHDIVYNRHETVKVSRPVIKAMLLSKREDAWEAVIKLLLSAQRQEGLRQTILECLDETSLGAMKTLIEVVVEHKLARFSSVVRAVDVWAGFGWESEREATVRRFLELAHTYLNHLDQVPTAIKSKDNAEVYMALWAQGVHDVDQCFALVDQVLEKGGIEKTALALYFIAQVTLPEVSLRYGLQNINSEHLLVLAATIPLLRGNLGSLDKAQKRALYTQLEAQLERVPAKTKTIEGKVFSWLNFGIDQGDIYGLMIDLVDFENEEEVAQLLSHYKAMPVNQRDSVTRHLLPDYSGWSFDETKTYPTLTTQQRDFAFDILKDRSNAIRTTALRALKNAEMEAGELSVFENMLKRTTADLRKSLIGILLKQNDETLKGSVGNLLAAKNQEQRLAGLDILLNLKTREGFDATWVTEQAQSFAEKPKITAKEEIILNTLVSEQSAMLAYNAENGFGLYDPANVAAPLDPALATDGEYVTKTKDNAFGLSQPPEKILEALDALKALFLTNQEHEYSYENWDKTVTQTLLGNEFTAMKRDTEEMSNEERFNNYPLAEVWKKWAEDYKITPCDLFLINLTSNLVDYNDEDKQPRVRKNDIEGLDHTIQRIAELVYVALVPKAGKHYWRNPIVDIVGILPLVFPYEAETEFLEGLCKAIFCNIHPDEVNKVAEEKTSWGHSYWHTWHDLNLINQVYSAYSAKVSEMTDEQFATFWQLEKWRNATVPKDYSRADQYMASLYNYSRTYTLKLISRDELMGRVMRTDAINELTDKMKPEDRYEIRRVFPFLIELAAEARTRILEIELKRGDSSTAVTKLAQNIQQIFGIQYFVDILVGIGKDKLHRGYIYSWSNRAYNKKEILSTLLKRCYPTKEETQAIFDEKVKATKITEKRLVEAAAYAPHWLPWVSQHLGWKGLESAAWWLHAHTNARHDSETETEVGKYSKVAMQDFSNGAVDIEWFKAAYKTLGKARWKTLYDSAKYISDGNGHKRAMLYADVILGNTKITEVRKRVVEKRNQDYLRVFGLVPLSKKKRDADLLKRYQYLQKFKKESKQFGSQRQTSEGLAVRIAMENLARTAGFSDPIRLTWAMETEEARTILENAEALHFDDVQIRLEVDEHGKSSLHITRGDKALKAIPAKLKKDKSIVALKEFNKTLQNQYKRTRQSLEEAMVNGDEFSLSEIQTLMTHPVVSPMLRKLVLKSGEALGFWQEGELVDTTGSTQAVGDTLQIAHCTDLYASGQWGAYQAYCFTEQMQQPFKQVFRELYVPTEDELGEKARSRRYAGHQVQPQKTLALLKTRGWTVNYEEGLQKTYHKEGFIARMFALADWFTPADVESPTLETVEFTNLKTWENVPFEEISPRIFSEVMRDIDLVVSVAHVGDVDPEASQSTIELRTAIVRETARLFKLDNVTLKGNHALIKGGKNDYSVHLGSAIAHKMPGVALSILPVHSQHRGRMFLPFLDEDPKTAEIMSKILLLAKEQEIQDPTILQQL